MQPSTDPVIDLDTLMARDPLELTNEDLDRIIVFLRTQRANYALGENKKAGRKDAKPVIQMSLDDLGI